jgi:hypothetical protein
MDKKSITAHFGTVTLIEPSIIKVKVHEGIVFDVKETHEIRSLNLELTNGKPYCLLLDYTKYFTITPEAKQLAASEEFSKYRIAFAAVVGSLAAKLSGNFFIKFNLPATPTRLFTNEKDALEWLRGFL